MGSTVSVGSAQIGEGSRCFLIAEAGVNHNGSLRLAHEMIDIAADSGVDAVKFQTFIPEKLAAPEARKAQYQVDNTGEEGSQLEMLRRLVLPVDRYPELIEHCATRNLLFLSTPFDEDSAEQLHQLHLPAFKISSGDLTNYPLLAKIAGYGKPMIVSTGMASLEDVDAAVAQIKAEGNPPLVLLHCVTSYPTRPEDCNLKAMATLRSRFSIPVGWSDHTEGIDISIAAAALGASVIEKHFTLDRDMPGPDHVASLEPPELTALVKSVRRAEAALGDGNKHATKVEIAVAAMAQRSLFWNRDLKAATPVGAEDVIALRPGTGISPEKLSSYLGRTVAQDVSKGNIVREEDFVSISG